MEFVTEKNVCGVGWCVCASRVEWETNPPLCHATILTMTCGEICR